MPPLIDLPEYLLRDAKLYAPGRDDQGAAIHVLEDYSRLVGEVRQLRSELHLITSEATTNIGHKENASHSNNDVREARSKVADISPGQGI